MPLSKPMTKLQRHETTLPMTSWTSEGLKGLLLWISTGKILSQAQILSRQIQRTCIGSNGTRRKYLSTILRIKTGIRDTIWRSVLNSSFSHRSPTCLEIKVASFLVDLTTKTITQSVFNSLSSTRSLLKSPQWLAREHSSLLFSVSLTTLSTCLEEATPTSLT